MKKKIGNVLIDLGITPELSGFDYICRMVEIIMSDTGREKSVCGMYAEVAEQTGTIASRVERGIRHARSKADCESKAWKKYMSSECTTNAKFLYTLAFVLKEK